MWRSSVLACLLAGWLVEVSLVACECEGGRMDGWIRLESVSFVRFRNSQSRLGFAFGFAAGRISLCCVAIDGGGYEGGGEGGGGGGGGGFF